MSFKDWVKKLEQKPIDLDKTLQKKDNLKNKQTVFEDTKSAIKTQIKIPKAQFEPATKKNGLPSPGIITKLKNTLPPPPVMSGTYIGNPYYNDDMADAIAYATHTSEYTPRKPVITAYSVEHSSTGNMKFTIEGSMMQVASMTGLKIHVPQQVDTKAVNGGFDVSFDFRQPQPSIQATEAILGGVMGIPLENENEVILKTLKTIMESIRNIFPWVNPKHDITLSLGSNRASCQVHLDMKHEIRVSVTGYDENEVSGEPINHILIAYSYDKSVVKQKVLKPMESDIIGMLSTIRGMYPTKPENSKEEQCKLFKPYIHNGGPGMTSHITTVFLALGIKIAHGEVFYLNPQLTAIWFPASWKSIPWRYAYNSNVFRRLINKRTIIPYEGTDHIPLTGPPTVGDLGK